MTRECVSVFRSDLLSRSALDIEHSQRKELFMERIGFFIKVIRRVDIRVIICHECIIIQISNNSKKIFNVEKPIVFRVFDDLSSRYNNDYYECIDLSDCHHMPY